MITCPQCGNKEEFYYYLRQKVACSVNATDFLADVGEEMTAQNIGHAPAEEKVIEETMEDKIFCERCDSPVA